MKRKLSLILSVLLALAISVSLTACTTKTPDEPLATEASKATDAPKDPTAEPTATPVPTDTPEPTATPEPKEIVKVDGLEAVITSFEYCDEEAFSTESEIEITAPFALLKGSIYQIFLCDEYGMQESVDMTEYPFLSMLYRVGYGGSIGGANHIYALSEESPSASQTENTWTDQEYICDADWHVMTFNAQEAFSAITSPLIGLQMYANSTEGEAYAVAYFGAFKSEEDANKYYEAFTAKYADVLVKSEPPKVEKTETVLDTADSFDGILYDFEEFYAEESVVNNVPEGWGSSQGALKSRYVENNGGVACNLAFDAIYYDAFVKTGTAYTMTLDLKNGGSGSNFGGILLNWGEEKNGPRNFFENNGLKGDGKGSIVGGSGIGINFTGANEIQIYVLTNVNAKLSYVDATFTVTADLNSQFNKVVIADNGTDTITLTIADELIATIKYAKPEMLGSDVTAYNERYYREVKIYDKAGTEVLTTEDAVMSIYKSVGFGARAHDLTIDNVQIK